MADKNKVYYGEYTLQHWIDLILTGNIVLPEYQRYFVWEEKQSEALVDSLLHNQFVPPVTIGSYVKGGKELNLILDGQQRLTSLLLHYFKVFPSREKCIVDLKKIETANENDDTNEDDINFIEWNFSLLLKLIQQNNLRDRWEIHDAAIKAGYEDLNSSIKDISFEEHYLGFSFIVPDSKNSKEQQKFYSKVFRSINIEGKKLLPMESRAALYYLNEDLVGLFSPDFVKKITVNDCKMDFVRYLALLSQYEKNEGTNGIARGYSKNIERYYENFIYAVVDDKQTKDFLKLSDIIFDLKYEHRIQKLKCIVEGMGLNKNYDSIIKLDTLMFGIIYFIIYKDKNIESDKYNDLLLKLQNQSSAFINHEENGKKLHSKNPSALKHLELRIQKSIEICEEFFS